MLEQSYASLGMKVGSWRKGEEGDREQVGEERSDASGSGLSSWVTEKRRPPFLSPPRGGSLAVATGLCQEVPKL